MRVPVCANQAGARLSSVNETNANCECYDAGRSAGRNASLCVHFSSWNDLCLLLARLLEIATDDRRDVCNWICEMYTLSFVCVALLLPSAFYHSRAGSRFALFALHFLPLGTATKPKFQKIELKVNHEIETDEQIPAPGFWCLHETTSSFGLESGHFFDLFYVLL